jgi:hypothetical protein
MNFEIYDPYLSFHLTTIYSFPIVVIIWTVSAAMKLLI